METNSDRDKSEWSYSDCETYEIRSIHLGKAKCKRKSAKTLSSSCDRFPIHDQSQLLSSISRKLKPSNIQVLSKRTPNSKKLLESFTDKLSISVSCFPQIQTCHPLIQSHASDYSLDYSVLQAKSMPLQKIIENVHSTIGDKRGCFEQNCPIKRKWLRRVAFYERQLKNVRLLRQNIGSCPEQIEAQINKDVTRTFGSNVVTKTKITVSQAGHSGDKYNLVECIRAVLRLYAVTDPEVGYVQGMNLLCGAVALHTKQTNSCFICFKEIMSYGRLREFYIDNFSWLSSELQELFHRQLKSLNFQFYDFLISVGVDHLMFLQHYITLFASIVDIQYMHIMIDLFMRDGINFLHKFCLGLLLRMKCGLMTPGEEDSVLIKLGSIYIQRLAVDWGDLITNCLKIDTL